ncbi:STAS domain-containing protein [Pseudonocardia kujensis]|uniref:STAS domain-containing protein n=1 Tax=Pseudonocardia kujensis TaxID=1128675 RepID=UPI001E5695FF|nr:STAS domain-containing protein [Pseudonocardia kujensis]MCE0763825.1 STAS domain-containing protein [Pseudonocardia kujensis]
MTEVSIDAREPEPGRWEISLGGEVDLDNADAVEQRLQDVITNRARSVVLDLGGLTYLDSAGIRTLFTLANRLELLQVGLEVVVPAGSPVRKAIRLVGLGEVVTVREG